MSRANLPLPDDYPKLLDAVDDPGAPPLVLLPGQDRPPDAPVQVKQLWGHVTVLLDKLEDQVERDWYAAAAAEHMGQPDTKVSDLCKEPGITRQTLYRHVSSSGELREAGRKAISHGSSST